MTLQGSSPPASLGQHISLFLPLSILMVADVRGSQDETISLRWIFSAWMVWSARRNNLSTSWLSITIISSTISVLIIVIRRDHHQKHQNQHHWGTIGFSHVLILSQMIFVKQPCNRSKQLVFILQQVLSRGMERGHSMILCNAPKCSKDLQVHLPE